VYILHQCVFKFVSEPEADVTYVETCHSVT